LPDGSVTFTCNSWVAPKSVDRAKRIFFSNKCYLPSQTPKPLKQLRKEELKTLQGKNRELVDPKHARPVIGGLSHRYPRRCKTGRKPCDNDPSSEKRYGEFYVPRDEEFSKAILAALPSLPKDVGLLPVIPKLIKAVSEAQDDLLQIDPPILLNKDRFSCIRDDEFARQTLAALNPYSIQLVQEWPLKRKLDPAVYGDPNSLITWEIVEIEIRGVMSALKNKRLFMLDYHDLLLPYVNKVRELDDSSLYASRTIFFLSDNSTLRPVAIELTCQSPPRCYDATCCWLWSLAKTHAVAHDVGYHQLISHWLRTHCCMEPYIIAANRELSAMHPIYKLLHPHFRYTMEINARARQSLINAGGIIESCFWFGKYSIELSTDIYSKLWRFDREGLPADLISRGLAVEDETAEHGVRLMIPDYPFANDGLMLTINAGLIMLDEELQGWWSEVRNIGHGDKRDEPWWPVIKTQDDLISVDCVGGLRSPCSCKFGQYGYGGYFPNRSTTARIRMPVEEPTEKKLKEFYEQPEKAGDAVMVTMDLLSTHSPDEEYLGKEPEASWANDPVIYAAYERFKGKLQYLEGYELLKPISEPGVTGMGVPYS
ncbi:hypothetical protein EUTSA_v10000639mg, partial [Eutrema salsugineum]